MTQFNPAPIAARETAADACARVLRGAILSGELAPGTKLPPERTLAKSLGVNRLTLRNALAQLVSAGLVSVKQGSGYTVRNYQRVGGLDLLPGLMALSAERGDLRTLARELLFLRRHLATAVLERVAQVANEQSIELIRVAVAEFADVVARADDTQEIAAADMNVLATLVEATGSPVLSLCFNPVASVLATFDQLRDAMYADPQANVTAYRLLLEWLKSPRPELSAPIIAELARRDEMTLGRIPQQKVTV